MKRLFFPSLILLTLAFLTGATWLRWGGMHPDCGRELLAPRLILSGGTLYRDIRYLYGPLPPYINALLFQLFGARLAAVFGAGIATAGFTALLLFALAKRVLSEPLAAMTSVLFLVLLAFGDYHWVGTFNFIMPYSFAATYGTLLALASLYLLVRHTDSADAGYLLSSGLALGLTLLCKVEISAALLGTHLAAILLRRRETSKALLILAAGVAPAVLVYGYFLSHLGFSDLVADNLFPPQAVGAVWQQDVMGIRAPWRNIALMAGSLGCTWAYCLAVLWLQRTRSRVHPAITGAGLILALGAVGALSADPIGGPLGISNQYRGLPLLTVLAAWSLWAKRRAQAPLLIFVFAGLLLGRKVLTCSAVHYGFFLLAPGLIVYHYFYLEFLPASMAFAAPLRSPFARRAILAFIALLAWRHVEVSAANYKRRTLVLKTEFGTMRLPDDNYDRAYARAIALIKERTAAGSMLAAIPDNLTLNFFTDRAAALPLDIFEPSGFHGQFSVENLLARLKAHPPDALAVPYGPGGGFPPGTEPLAEFFQKGYRLEGVIESAEPGSPPMRINLLKRGPAS